MKTELHKPVQRLVPIDSKEIVPHPKNPRRGKVSVIKDSIKTNGYYPTIFIQESTNRILKGKHTWQALQELYQSGFEQYKEVTINVLDVTDEEALRIVLADNAASDYSSYSNEDIYEILSELDKTELGLAGTLWTGQEFEDLGFALNKNPVIAAEEIEAPTEEEIKERLEEGETIKEEEKVSTMHEGYYDIAFPSEDTFEIPILDINMQAEVLELPFMVWSMQRASKALPRGEVATLSFYAHDVTFEPLWKNPDKIVEQRVRQVVEVNFSCNTEMPMAAGLWQIYRKRWLSRYWQSKGIKIVADLCVAEKFQEINFLGIPRGWQTYCDRGYSGNPESYLRMYEKCVAHADGKPVSYSIYGGGAEVRNLCSQQGWLWLPDEKTLMHGKHVKDLAEIEKAVKGAKK